MQNPHKETGLICYLRAGQGAGVAAGAGVGFGCSSAVGVGVRALLTRVPG